MIFVIFSLPLLMMVLMIAGMWKTFEKAGEAGWAALLPFYNFFVLLKIAQKPAWFILLFFVPFANFFALVSISMGIAKNFGKDTGFGLGLLFLSPIFYPILGFGDATYGHSNNGNSPAAPVLRSASGRPLPPGHIMRQSAPSAPSKSSPRWLVVAGITAMCVFGFVGIMALISVPNFTKYQAKAKMSEAKLALSQLYTLQKAFQAEHGFYTTDLKAVGFDQALGNYTVGFSQASAPASIVGAEGDSVPLDPSRMKISAASRNPSSELELSRLCSDCTAGSTSFRAVAVGWVDGKIDAWTMNENSQLEHLEFEGDR